MKTRLAAPAETTLSHRNQTQKASSVVDRDFTLWALLRLTEKALFKARERELQQYGISVEQAAVCFYIFVIGEKATPAELSRWMLREPHTITGILNRMEAKGLVRRLPDKNQVRVVLTDEGYQVYEQSTRSDSIHRVVSNLSEAEYQNVAEGLKKLQDAAIRELGIFNGPPFPP